MAATPSTSTVDPGGPALRRYLIFYGLAMAGITVIWGGVGGILLPLQVQDIEYARWFTGPDAGANLQELGNLKAQIEAGTPTAYPSGGSAPPRRCPAWPP